MVEERREGERERGRGRVKDRQRDVTVLHCHIAQCTGGVGFDINCGVRLLRTNLFEKDVRPIKEQLAQVHV